MKHYHTSIIKIATLLLCVVMVLGIQTQIAHAQVDAAANVLNSAVNTKSAIGNAVRTVGTILKKVEDTVLTPAAIATSRILLKKMSQRTYNWLAEGAEDGSQLFQKDDYKTALGFLGDQVYRRTLSALNDSDPFDTAETGFTPINPNTLPTPVMRTIQEMCSIPAST